MSTEVECSKHTSFAISSTSKSDPTVMIFVLILNISSLPAVLGGPTKRIRSSRPGLIRAESWKKNESRKNEDSDIKRNIYDNLGSISSC